MKTTLLTSILLIFSFAYLIGQTKYEAEDGTITGATFSDSGDGFSGTGYIIFGETGSVTVTVDVEAAGSYPLSLGYRSVFGEKIQDLYVNGELAQNVTFPQSDDFTSLDVNPVELNAGSNTIEIRKSYGYMDLDYFSVGTMGGSDNFEAEDGTVTDATISNEGTGFSGSGYVVFEDKGSVSINVEMQSAGAYPLTLGYRAKFGEKKQDLYVNGALVKQVTFPESMDFTSIDVGTVTLVSGENTIEIRKSFGYMDLDYFSIGEKVDSNNYEAEDGTITDATISSEGTGYAGTGYVVFEDSGTVAISVEVGAAGSYPLTLGYRSRFGEKIQDLYVNDSLIQNITFPESAVFTSIDIGSIPLNAGINTIEIRKSFGYMDLDYFSLGSFKVPGALEAEDGTVVGANFSNAVPGFSGTGYIVFEATGSVSVTVEREGAGSYPLTFGYRSVFGDKPQDLYVNGNFMGQVNFLQSDVFTTLDYGLVQLNAGANTIEIRKSYGYMDLDYFLIGDESSPVPVANAGFQQVKMDLDGDGVETFTLDASGSTDANDDIVSYTWYLQNGDVAGEGLQLTFEAAIGGAELTLEVKDAMGNVDTDTVKLFVGDPTNGGNNRIGVVNNSQLIFSDGINLAWDKFASDVTDLDASYFEEILDSIQASGGNTMRWWLHTNGANSPQFDAAGNVTGLDPNAIPNMRTVLDLAYNRGIAVSMCLWSFDMLRDQGQDITVQKALLEDREKTQTYIDNALIPILEEIGAHPAVLTWEIFNEAENMTEEFGFTQVKTPMAAVQQFINLTAGAIHKTVPGAMVSSGAGSFSTMTDIEGHTNYYRDDRLIAAGGDPLGTLDFYQVHYYPQNFALSLSPFHRPADWWQLDKPIVIGEFPSKSIEEESDAPSYTIVEAYKLAYEYGYAGALAWDYRGFDGGSFETARAGIAYLAETYPEDIDLNIDPDLINNPPSAIAGIPDLNLLLGAAERIDNYVSLDTLFYDKEDLTNLEYSISSNTNPDLVTAEITEDAKLNLILANNVTGTSILTIRARDTKGASASISFRVNIRDANGNLALFKPIVASSSEKEDLRESYANDGDMNSRWSSIYQNDQWIYVDLQKPAKIDSVKLFWEAAYGMGYEIQTSDDAQNWVTVFTETDGDGGEDSIALDGVTTRYVRMFGHIRGTQFGFSLFEFEVYGETVLGLADQIAQEIVLYPNPIERNDLKLQVRDQNPITVELIDLLGRTVNRFELQGQTIYAIDTANLARGVSLVKISGENWTNTEKIVKK